MTLNRLLFIVIAIFFALGAVSATYDCDVFTGIGTDVSEFWMVTKDIDHPQLPNALEFFGVNSKGYFGKIYGIPVIVTVTPHKRLVVFAGWEWETRTLGHPTCGVFYLGDSYEFPD